MTLQERDRLVKVEQIVAGQQESLKSIERKLDHFMSIADMGKGALWLSFKVGGVMAMAVAGLWALFDKLHKIGGTP
ncbi:MAG: hypothetical protein ACK4JB_23865 [Reyranella sp.]